MTEQCEFVLRGYKLAAQRFGKAGGVPILAAHGWLDNAGTFDLLAPLLSGCEVVAVDFAGHGLSGFRSPDASYSAWQDIEDLFEVRRQLGWRRVNLLGHSRGAAIAMMFAGTFPEYVSALVLIEGGAPIVSRPEQAPEKLARALRERDRLLNRTGRLFPDRTIAIRERAQGFTKLTTAAAEILARRSLREVQGGFRWHADQRLKRADEISLTRDHVRAFARAVQAPVLMLLALDGFFDSTSICQEMIKIVRNIEVVRLPGGHHLHLEGAAGHIADRTLAFLGAPSGHSPRNRQQDA